MLSAWSANFRIAVAVRPPRQENCSAVGEGGCGGGRTAQPALHGNVVHLPSGPSLAPCKPVCGCAATAGTPAGKFESMAAGRGMVRVDPFNCASPAVPSPLTYWNIDLGQTYQLRGVVLRAMAVPGTGARHLCFELACFFSPAIRRCLVHTSSSAVEERCSLCVSMGPGTCSYGYSAPGPLTTRVSASSAYRWRWSAAADTRVVRAGAKIEVRAARTTAELSVYAGGNPICTAVLLTVSRLNQPINCTRIMAARFITVSSTDGAALPVCALDALVDDPPAAPPPAAPPAAPPAPADADAAPAPAPDASSDSPAPPAGTGGGSGGGRGGDSNAPQSGGQAHGGAAPQWGSHGGGAPPAMPWGGGQGAAGASAGSDQGAAVRPPAWRPSASARVRPLAPAEVAVMFGAATSSAGGDGGSSGGSGGGGDDASVASLRSGLAPRAAPPSGAQPSPVWLACTCRAHMACGSHAVVYALIRRELSRQDGVQCIMLADMSHTSQGRHVLAWHTTGDTADSGRSARAQAQQACLPRVLWLVCASPRSSARCCSPQRCCGRPSLGAWASAPPTSARPWPGESRRGESRRGERRRTLPHALRHLKLCAQNCLCVSASRPSTDRGVCLSHVALRKIMWSSKR